MFVISEQIYEILIRPIEPEIKNISPQNLAIIATGKLRYIPFETLYDRDKEKFLLEKYPIHYGSFNNMG
ncbi:MAG: CHAT domain-containing protein [Crocosphaera sp.]|nr:CHAT domain-containing protein [Crocosphaera sp.]